MSGFDIDRRVQALGVAATVPGAIGPVLLPLQHRHLTYPVLIRSVSSPVARRRLR